MKKLLLFLLLITAINYGQTNTGTFKTGKLRLDIPDTTTDTLTQVVLRDSITGMTKVMSRKNFLKGVGSATSASNYWTKTGNDIQNNNIGHTKIKLNSGQAFTVLNNANEVIYEFNEFAKVFCSGLQQNSSAKGFDFLNNYVRFYTPDNKGFQFDMSFPVNITSGTSNVIQLFRTSFEPTSGNAQFNVINLDPTINQTGGANGISRALYINPTLTSAADFRAIEVTVGKSIFQQVNATSFVKDGGLSTQFLMADGSTSTSTGYWTANGDDIYKNNSGNVGIGTTTPNNRLEIATGAQDVSGLRLKNLNGTTKQTFIRYLDTFNSYPTNSVFYNNTIYFATNTNYILKQGAIVGNPVNHTATSGQATNLIVDSLGNIYFTYSNGSSIYKAEYNAPWIPTYFASTGGSGAQGFAIDSNNNIYVANSAESTVYKISPAGVSTFVGNFEGPVSTAYGERSVSIAVSPLTGDVFVARSNNNYKLWKINTSGVTTYSTTAVSCGTTSLTCDSLGNIYATDNICGGTRKIEPTGTTGTMITPGGSKITVISPTEVYAYGGTQVNEISSGVGVIIGTLPLSEPINLFKETGGNLLTVHTTPYALSQVTPNYESSSLIADGNGDIKKNNDLYFGADGVPVANNTTYLKLKQSIRTNALITKEYLTYFTPFIDAAYPSSLNSAIRLNHSTRLTTMYESFNGKRTIDLGWTDWDGYGFLHGAKTDRSNIFGTHHGRTEGYYSIVLGGEVLQTKSYGEIAMGYYNTIAPSGTLNLHVPTDRLMTIGNGVYGTPSDALKILKNGLTTLPSVTNALITAESTGKAVVTREYLESKQIQRLAQYTVATLPTGAQGDTAYVTDATAPTYIGTLTGGGSVVCPVFYNGTAWVSH
jgi:hypothetical protein